jgi:hypothetical protein
VRRVGKPEISGDAHAKTIFAVEHAHVFIIVAAAPALAEPFIVRQA